MRTRHWIAAIVVVGLTGAARLTQADPVEDGKKIVEAKKCSICHAHEGKGGKTGKPMAELAADKSDDFLKGSLLDPKKTIAADTKMPSYQGKLTDDEVAAVIAYMKSLKK